MFQKFKITILCAVLWTSMSCSKNNEVKGPDSTDYSWSSHVPFQPDYEVNFVPQNEDYQNDPINLGQLRLEEASGIAPSIKNVGMLWVHEDNSNRIYLISGTTAEILCTYRVTGSTNNDWEDMEIVTDLQTGKIYIYIADTGDNDQARSSVSIYRIEEPVYSAADLGKTLTTEQATRYIFQYQDGKKDVESMLVDPATSDIYLVTKRDERSRLYILPSPQVPSGNTAYHVGNFGFKEASAATANKDASKFIVRNRQHLFYWERKAGEKIWETLKRTPERLPFIGEIQGEAVCFDADDNYYTTSERGGTLVYPPVYKYIKK